MTQKKVFSFLDYKAYLRHTEEIRKNFERGFRTKLAATIDCHSGFVSNVLNGSAHFSPEQITAIAKFLGLKAAEQKYLYTLLQFARAGTSELKSFIKNELETLQEEQLNIKRRVGNYKSLSESDQAIYYSSWHYTAIHLITMIPSYRTAPSIAAALQLPEAMTKKALFFLVQTGLLAEKKNGEFETGQVAIHLDRESPHIRQHHTNWRVAAIRSLADDQPTDLHYSTISTIAKSDADKLRAEMILMIENYVETVRPSKEEEMIAFNLDFYSLTKK